MIPAAWVVLDRLPLTSGGKLDRKALPAPSTERPDIGPRYEAPATDVEQQLGEIWSELLRLNQVGIHDNFFALGGDSILAIQVIGRARQRGLRLHPHQIFQFQTIRELAAHVEVGARAQAEQGLIEGETILAPIQRWFFEQDFSEAHHWNQSVVLKVNRTVSPESCENALDALLWQHDVPRSTFSKDSNGNWHQHIEGRAAARISLKQIDTQGLSEAECRERVAEEGSRLQSDLDLGRGPLVRAAWFDRGADEAARLLIVAHHLVVDGVSWRILLEDLETAIRQLERDEEVRLGEKTSSYRQWTDALVEVAASGKLDSERDFWLEQVEEPAPRIPVDSSDGANDVASEDRVTLELDESDTRRLLHDLPSLWKTQPHEVLLAALVSAWNRWSGQPRLRVQVEAHGRDQRPALLDTDISRTVGWFTAAFPVVCEWPGGNPVEAVRAIKEQWRRVPLKGVGYGILRYLGEDEQLRKRLAANEPEISFNYLGQVDAGVARNARLELTRDFAGPDSSGASRRTHILEILVEVAGGRLRVDCVYSRNRHRRSTVEQLAAMMNDELRELLQLSSPDRNVALTPSDFSGANLTQAKIEKVLRMVSGKRRA
jgi:non-ribosomal peptide synthase protein (TIGR01720 family)